MIRTRLAILSLIAIAGCAAPPPPREVLVPIRERLKPPEELLAPLPAPPMFVAPAAPKAAACLTSPEGIATFKTYARERNARLRGWEAWAREPSQEQP